VTDVVLEQAPGLVGVPVGALPLVTILVPCRNESKFISDCLLSIVGNGYPESRLQVLVLDGMSEDGTMEIVERMSVNHPCITPLRNERRITPAALNLGVASAKGEFLVWMSAHNSYEPGYIRSCVDWALRTGADNVGGVIIAAPRRDTILGRAIAIALADRFGNGGSKFRSAIEAPVWADTVFGGCYRRDVFDRVGLFNENLVRGQDFEFNMRLRRAGLRTLLVPTIRSTYYARSTAIEFFRHNWANGVWAILPFKYTDVVPVSFRHLVPMLFVGSVLASAALAIFFQPFRWAALLIVALYLVAVLAASARVAFREKSVRLFFVMAFVFSSLHFAYGLGSLWAASRSLPALAASVSRVSASAIRQSRAGPSSFHAKKESRTL